MEKFGSGLNIPDPQHWLHNWSYARNQCAEALSLLREKDLPGHPSSRYYISGPTFETGVSVRWKGGGAGGGEVHGGGALGVAQAAQ